jgi:NADH:ubiquinone oxidoreductase subunit
MSHGHFLTAFRRLGLQGTFREIFRKRTLKFGKLVGTDAYGNKYYENTVDYANGQHRWVDYARGDNFYDMDASNVPPEWHGWLHHSTDELPTAVRI